MLYDTRWISAAAMVALLGFALPAHAEEATASKKAPPAPLHAVPDRPTVSTSAVTVRAGHAQIEAGGEFDTTSGTSLLSFPIMARLGVAKSFELRAGFPAIVAGLSSDASSDLGPIELGSKVAGKVTDWLSLGAMPFFDIGSASEDSAVWAQSSYGIMGLADFSIAGGFGLTANLGATVGPGSSVDAGPRELFYNGVLTAGYSLGSLGLALEGFTTIGQVADPVNGADLSASYAIVDTLVVDAYAGMKFASGTNTTFAGVGVTYIR